MHSPRKFIIQKLIIHFEVQEQQKASETSLLVIILIFL